MLEISPYIKHQRSLIVFKGEVLQSFDHLWNLLWIHFKRSTSFLCGRPQSWMQYSRWGLIRSSRRGELSPSASWPCLFWCNSGYSWFSGLQVHTAFISCILVFTIHAEFLINLYTQDLLLRAPLNFLLKKIKIWKSKIIF